LRVQARLSSEVQRRIPSHPSVDAEPDKTLNERGGMKGGIEEAQLRV